jgi:dTDP-glucose 4,6-dehydratase
MTVFVTDRKGHDFRYAINSSKILAHYGWKAKISLTNGLNKTLEWYNA